MNLKCLSIAVTLCGLVACSTPKSQEDGNALAPDQPEAVMVIYHPKRGAEGELRKALERAWEYYRSNRMVLAEPHVCVQVAEPNQSRFVEIFVWVTHFAQENSSQSFTQIWEEVQSLCEERDGKQKIEGREVKLLIPERRRLH